MKLPTVILIGLCSCLISARKSLCPGRDDLTVRTTTGTYTGIVDPEFPHTRQFRSIPFAKPPVQSLRWLPPQKLTTSPDDHHYATRFPPSCAQYVSGIPSFWNGDLTRGNLINNGAQNDTSGLVGEASSEDCLQLAVWTPSANASKPADGFPVIFFMTGGGFTMGGVNIPWQMPTEWVEQSQDFVFVSINYRLGIFGFPNAAGLDGKDQNLGLLDMRAALEWTHENIAAFGGDPTRITQWGRSAGSVGADALSYAYAEDPIARAYWMQSGSVMDWATWTDASFSNFTFVAKHFDCAELCADDEAENARAELDCLRQVPFAQLVNFIGPLTESEDGPWLAHGLVVDNRTVFADYHERAEAGKFARVPYIYSGTANEFGSLLWSGDPEMPPDQDVVDESTISFFVCPLLNSTAYRNMYDVPVFRFQHAGVFPNLNQYEFLGAYHASDIPISFGTSHIMDHVAPTTKFQEEVSQSMRDHFLAFVKDPYKGPQKLGWEPMDTTEANGGSMIRFGSGDKVVQLVDGIEVEGVCYGAGEYEPFP